MRARCQVALQWYAVALSGSPVLNVIRTPFILLANARHYNYDTGEHMNEQRSSPKLVMNRRALADRDALFAALELFVNCGDGAADLKRFRQQHPNFFSPDFYDQSERLAKSGKPDNYFSWMKRLLRSVWKGRDPVGLRLEVLLGMRSINYHGHAGGDFAAEVNEHLAILDELVHIRGNVTEEDVNLAANLTFPAHVRADWLGSGLQYEPAIDFQKAVYALMSESWRARVCPMCARYLIAAKPANIYCSLECAGRAKQKRDLGYWNIKGKPRRSKRTKANKR
jgi:hypothetical protein